MSAIFACVLAAVPVTARAQMSQDVAPDDTTDTTPQDKQSAAADDCLIKPAGQAPQGQRWSYRIERGTQRHCWYLHDKPIAATTAAPKPVAKTADAPAARPMAAPQPRPNSDARAELPSARGRTEPDAALAQRTRSPLGTLTSADRAAGLNGDDDSTPAANASRAIQPLDTMSAATSTADAAPATANAPAADTGATIAAPTAPEQPADAMAPTDAAPRKTSLQMLLMVIFGALFFAGLTASLIPRLSYVWRKRRARLRRRTMWQSAGRARKPSTLAMKLENPAQIPEQAAAPDGRVDVQKQQDEAQGQIEELLSGIAKRVRRPRPQGPASAVASSPAAAAARGRRSSARRGARV